ncbi:hypothetical protein HY948_05005 [Candidatus Gottesmanbacteria bacterium]|nr:hypothetical protein [Candidatus Gottesmanbacteria bacterium]
MNDATYQKFLHRWEQVTDLPPQTVGPFTPYYKRAVKRLKVMPWPVLVGVGLVSAIVLYVALGSAVTLVASLLQRGF